MRLLVCGGRNFADRKLLQLWMNLCTCSVPSAHQVVIIHGAARGADRLAADIAKNAGVQDVPFPAPWHDISHPKSVIRYRNGRPYNAGAGSIRNQQMLDEGRPDAVLAMPGGSGTADMVRRAKLAGLPVYGPEHQCP